jgi:hypothetical protein
VSVWCTLDARDLLFELAKAEERSVKITLRRALLAYAENSEEYGRWVRSQKPRAKAAA